jgi:hypothetical protein
VEDDAMPKNSDEYQTHPKTPLEKQIGDWKDNDQLAMKKS